MSVAQLFWPFPTSVLADSAVLDPESGLRSKSAGLPGPALSRISGCCIIDLSTSSLGFSHRSEAGRPSVYPAHWKLRSEDSPSSSDRGATDADKPAPTEPAEDSSSHKTQGQDNGDRG